MKKTSINAQLFIRAIVLAIISVASTAAQTTEFTYQGKLSDTDGQAAAYDFVFRLCASETASCSTPLATSSQSSVSVSSGGIFTVKLDFGAANFDGMDRFLEIAVRRANTGNFVTLAPRQKLTSAPYSIQTLKANDASQLGGTAANQYVLTTDPRLSATNYVQNGTTAQTGVNFNIGGTGTANVLNAATQFNLGGSRIFSNQGQLNLFAGIDAGAVTTGGANAFFGSSAGKVNTTGDNNAFFGAAAGSLNTTGRFNSFFGTSSGGNNSTGSSNTFIGQSAGSMNSTGSSNTFLGVLAGNTNSGGSNNTILGAGANLGNPNLSFATALGAGATVGTSNTLVLGRTNDAVQSPGSLTVGRFINVGEQYFLGSRLYLSNGGASNNTYVGDGSNCPTTANGGGTGNTFVGFNSGSGCTTGIGNTVIGTNAGIVGASNFNTIIGIEARVAAGATVNNSTAIGYLATVSTSNTIVLGRDSATTFIPGNLRVASSPDTVNGVLMENVTSTTSFGPGIGIRTLYVDRVPLIYLNADMCFQRGISGNSYAIIGSCANDNAPSSLKADSKPFTGGIEIVKRLQPFSFRWKENNLTGIGLNAEEAAAVDGKLVSRDEKGEVTKVSESSLNAVLINAVKEQQAQIEAQQKQIDVLKKLVCAMNAAADVCKEEK